MNARQIATFLRVPKLVIKQIIKAKGIQGTPDRFGLKYSPDQVDVIRFVYMR